MKFKNYLKNKIHKIIFLISIWFKEPSLILLLLIILSLCIKDTASLTGTQLLESIWSWLNIIQILNRREILRWLNILHWDWFERLGLKITLSLLVLRYQKRINFSKRILLLIILRLLNIARLIIWSRNKKWICLGLILLIIVNKVGRGRVLIYFFIWLLV